MSHSSPIRFLRSLRSRILLLALLACVLLASALTGFFLLLRQTQSTIIADSASHLFNVVNSLGKDYLSSISAPSSSDALQALEGDQNPGADSILSAFSVNAFRRDPGVEGGFYSSAADNLLGYAFPTNDGPGPKRDIPPRERPTILSVAQQAAATVKPASFVFRGQKDVILFQAVPLSRNGQIVGSVWGMCRIHDVESGRNLQALFGVSCLALAAMACVGVAFWITRNVQADVSTIQGRLQDLELDLNHPRRGDVSAAELGGILSGIDRLGVSLREKIAKERHLVEQLHHKERLASLGQVAAGVAHELRNPLATIRLRTQMSLRSRDSEQLDRSAKLILEEIDRLSSVLDRLLYFAKPIQLQTKTFGPTQMCEDVLSALQPEAANASIEFLCKGSHSEQVSGDALKLRQVMENLIRNAMESFDSAARMPKRVVVSILSIAGDLHITVEDNGAGLPENISTKAFDPFFTTKTRGTGLGLSIANEIVRAHQGTLTLRGMPGAGTVADITLPREVESQSEAGSMENRGAGA